MNSYFSWIVKRFIPYYSCKATYKDGKATYKDGKATYKACKATYKACKATYKDRAKLRLKPKT